MKKIILVLSICLLLLVMIGCATRGDKETANYRALVQGRIDYIYAISYTFDCNGGQYVFHTTIGDLYYSPLKVVEILPMRNGKVITK